MYVSFLLGIVSLAAADSLEVTVQTLRGSAEAAFARACDGNGQTVSYVYGQ